MNEQTPKIFENISTSLGIDFDGKRKEISLTQEKRDELTQAKIETDFEYARQNLKQLIEKGKESLDNAISLAESLDSPRGFEVVSNFAKQLAEMNKDLIDLYKQKNDAEKEKITVNNNTTNAIYVGSTSDLQDLVNQDRSRKKALNNGEAK